MKIIGFSQLRNELEKGNLENWFQSMLPICDHIYIFDQASTDRNIEHYKTQPKTKIVVSERNYFLEEIRCKAFLLELIYKDHPDVDWIFWMDGDTILDGRLSRNVLESLLKEGNSDAVSLGHINLWRSDVHYRIDSAYHSLNDRGVICFWNAKKQRLTFGTEVGHHRPQFPPQIKSVKRIPFVLLHKGFTTDEQIIGRYDLYKSMGQSGWSLNRLLSERDLEVQKADPVWYPEWFRPLRTLDPRSLTPIATRYNESKH